MTVASEILKAAIVYVNRTATRSLIESELKERGAVGTIACDSTASCMNAMLAHPYAPLFIDTDRDERELVMVLRSAQGRLSLDTRPIYVIAYAIDEKTLAYALEYNILQIHTGDLSKNQVSLNMEEMLRYGRRTSFQVEIYRMVLEARRSGALEEALGLLESLWKKEPDNIQAADELGMAYCDLERWEEAQVHLVEVVAHFPFDTRAKHLLARCFMKQGDYSKARYYLEQASVLSPFNAERLVDIARIFLDEYQVEKALGSFKAALDLDPDLAVARIGRAQCELLLGEANSMIKIMRQLTDLYEFASVFNGAAIVAIRAGHFQQGIGLYKTAVGYLVEHPDLMSRVFFNMGLGLWKWGKGTLAFAAFQKAVELDASNTKAKHNAAQIGISLRRRPRRENEDGPFSALNRIDTMEDFDELGEETFRPVNSHS